jgi:hypothetical protein
VYLAYAVEHGKPRAADKTPRNVLHVGRIAAALPESRFVHLVRDGRDVVPSVREHLLGPQTLPGAIDFWRDRVLAGQRAGRALGPQRYLEVRYEDLVAAPEDVLPAVCAFLDLEYTEAMLDYPGRSDRVISGMWDQRRHAGVARPPTVGVRDWRTTMPRADVQLFDALAGDLLDELGYGRSRPVTTQVARRRRKARRRSDPGAPPVGGDRPTG